MPGSELRDEVGTLSDELQKLRVVSEQFSRDLKLVMEVQERCGHKLDETLRALEPLVRLDDFIRSITYNRESRVWEFPKSTSLRA
jgi:hypothetical protein